MSDTAHDPHGAHDGHDHGHGHGHGAAPQFDIIPESGAIDTFLTYYACTIALVILCIFGGSMLTGHPIEEHGGQTGGHGAPHGETHGSPSESPAH